MRPLTRHLDDVNETYFEHCRHALGFAVAMFVGSLACLVHALVPFLFERTGSRCIGELHDRMVVNRHKLSARAGAGFATAAGNSD